jgi:hypothetical protein
MAQRSGDGRARSATEELHTALEIGIRKFVEFWGLHRRGAAVGLRKQAIAGDRVNLRGVALSLKFEDGIDLRDAGADDVEYSAKMKTATASAQIEC